MAQLVLLVVAAAWLAVLIPPMLRSRVQNHPNSSVTDFRRQLNKLQATATPPRGSVRVMGRPLAASPLQRPAAAGRPGQPAGRSTGGRSNRDQTPHGGVTTASRPARSSDGTGDNARYRSHGDPTGGQARPQRTDTTGPSARPSDPRSVAKQRRTNVLFVLFITTACTLFLAATTKSTAMLYGFALAFLALCGYVYLLAQLRQRDESGWNDGWLAEY